MNQILQATIQMAPRPAQEGQPQPSPFASLVPLILIFVIFYFLLIRPQSKKAKEHQEMVKALKVGDEIKTSGGIYGRITRVGEERLTIEIADKVRIQIGKGNVAEKVVDAGDTKEAQ